jgi:Protein of unknown function (DUF4054)
MWTNPTVAQFKTQFTRDFPYGNTTDSVMTVDINNAFNFVTPNINQSLFSDQATYTLAYLLLAAHYLVLNLRASSQGISGQYNFLQGSKGVGAVAESFNIPQRILDNPDLAMLCKTNYGAMYVQMVIPLLSGQMMAIYGGTNP